MVFNAKHLGWYRTEIYSVYRAFLWWVTPERLFYFFLLRIVKRCVVPFVKLGLIILLKRNVIGEFTEMTATEKQTDWNRYVAGFECSVCYDSIYSVMRLLETQRIQKYTYCACCANNPFLLADSVTGS